VSCWCSSISPAFLLFNSLSIGQLSNPGWPSLALHGKLR
jgi:hypothetical protein